ncbi:type IV pilus twitching motility protein PilT [uncultured Veillonella sp.]|uniref:type IV pilus twitching motility protein PilT n=1 Tax=uncultured Veillonella sp. TaxID=159268 RepID=UPI0025F635B6|nr:ATPase, T2SS/T4P/T4SS family [uncultured Veillonella sp.]
MLYPMLDWAIKYRATDIHLEYGGEPRFRLGADLVKLEELSAQHTYKENGPEMPSRTSTIQVDECIFSQLIEVCHGDLHMVDGAFSYGDIRVRVHLFKAQEIQCGTLRLLYNGDLQLPDDEEGELLKKLALLKEGLVIISGPTGSGKSFALASCIQHINLCESRHIVTLEDPIEFVFSNQKSLIHQRQLGQDVSSMALGIKEALRQDPDVIMIGELRDRPTLEAALHAAETGHLVFATLHTQRAVMAINRIISIFPGEQQEEVRSQLSQVLRAVICQRLVRKNNQFITVRDILLNNSAVANLIRQRKEPQIVSIQEMQRPMQTMEMAVAKLQYNWGHCEELEAVLEDI